MSQAEALLATLAETVIEHEHPVRDVDTYFIIDPDTRAITNASRTTNIIMQYDHDSERFTFELPRVVEGHDMMMCNRVFVHWNNIDARAKREVAESTEIDDLRVNPDDSSTVICSWLISRNSTQLAGNLSFLVQYKCVVDEETVYEWHTDIYSDVEVKPGRNNGEQSVIEYTDIIEQWRAKLFGAGDTVIEEIAAASEEQKASIESKGAETLATIPEDYTATYNMANDALRTRANAIVVTAEGETVVAEDCSDDYLRGLLVYGKTTQVSTHGFQLINSTAASGSAAGITFTVNNDNSVYARGTATAAAYLALEGGYAATKVSIPDRFVPGETYTITDASFFLYGEDGSTTSFTNQSFVMPDGYDYYGIFIRVNTGAVVDKIYYPMINEGSVALTYEPYSGGVVSPSPEWSQGLVSIEDPSIELYGRNLLDQNGEFVSNYSTYSLVANVDHGVITISGTSMLGYGTLKTSLPLGVFKKGQTYRISRVDGNFHVGFWFYDKSNVNIGSLTTENSLAFTVPDSADHISFFYAGLTPEAEVNLTEKFMLNLGSEALPWEPSVDTQTISLAHALSGIPVTTGGNYTDSNGQQWICDEIDFEHGVHIQRIREITIDGSQAVATDGAEHNPWRKYIWINAYPALAEHGGLCDKLRHRNSTELIAGNDVDDAGFSLSPHYNVIYFNVGHWMTEDTVEAATRALAEYPLTIKYALKNPIETPLTDEELFAFSQLHSNQLVTTALNSENAYMGLVYNADTKTYFTNSRASDEQVNAAVDAWLTKYFANAEGVSF